MSNTMAATANGAIGNRMQEITGSPARVDALDQELIDADSLVLIRNLAASAGNPQTEFPVINRYLRTLVKHPSLFQAQVVMGQALFGGVIPARDRELAVLRIAWLCGAPYEWGEHVRMAKESGVSGTEIEQVTEGPSCSAWSANDRAILAAVDELVGDQMITDGTWQALQGFWNEQQLIEFPMMVGQYIATACIQNSLRVPLSKRNSGLMER